MKILFVAPRYHTNQVGIVKTLKESGVDVTFDVINVGATEDYNYIKPNVIEESLLSKIFNKIVTSKKANRYYSFPSLIKYYFHLKRENPNIIIIRDPMRFFSIVSTVCARLLGIKIVFYTQENKLTQSKRPTRTKIQLIYKRFFGASWITPIGGEDTLVGTYLPFVVNSSNVKNIYNFENTNNFNILSIGKYIPRKNMKLLVDAVVHIKNNSDYKLNLTILGECSNGQHESYKRHLEEYVLENNAGKYIRLLSNIEYGRVENYYSESDLFVLPSSNDPAPISVLESIANEVPAICSNSSGTSSYIREGISGEVFISDDLSSLIDKITQVLDRYDNGFDYRKMCLLSSSESFSSDVYLSLAKKIYKTGNK